MGAVRFSTSKFQGSSSGPSVRKGLTQIVSDGEAELGHSLHVLGTAVGGFVGGVPVLGSRVGGLEGGGVDAVVEEEEGLQVSRAGFGGEGRGVFSCFCGVAFAEPTYSC